MITKVEAFSAQESAPELQLSGSLASDDPVQIRDIQGLGPVKAEISKTPFATGRGVLYQGSSVADRNIVISLGLNPNWQNQTMSTLRQLLYRYFLPQAWTKLRFYSDYLPPVDIEGYVESFEPNIFSQDPEIQISIICPKPDFIDPNATIISGIVDDGTIENEFVYSGTIPTGYELIIRHTDTNPEYIGKFTVITRAPSEPQMFEVEPVTINDTKYFKLSSVANGKRVQTVAYADAEIENLLPKMDAFSVWPQFNPGENVVQVIASEPGLTWTLAYFNRYGGL